MATKNRKKVVIKKANQLKGLKQASTPATPITTTTTTVNHSHKSHQAKSTNLRKIALLAAVGLVTANVILVGAMQLFSPSSTSELNLSKNKTEIATTNTAINTIDSNIYLTNAVNRAVGRLAAFDLNDNNNSINDDNSDAATTATAANAANSGDNSKDHASGNIGKGNGNTTNTANNSNNNNNNKEKATPQKPAKQLLATQLNNTPNKNAAVAALQPTSNLNKRANTKKLAQTLFSQNNKLNVPITVTVRSSSINNANSPATHARKDGKNNQIKQMRAPTEHDMTQIVDEGDETPAKMKVARKNKQPQMLAENNPASAATEATTSAQPATPATATTTAVSKPSFFARLFGLDNTTDPIEKDMKIFLRKSKQLRPEVLKLALKAYTNAQAQGIQPTRPIITIIDYSLASTAKRMWVLDLARKKVLFNSLVAHGRASGENYSTSFSDRVGSLQSSIGLFVTGNTYEGQHGYSLKIRGLDYGFNTKAEERAIVIHGAPYVNEQLAKIAGRIGRSWGCPAVEPQLAASIIDTIKGGTIVFSYYPDNKWLHNSKFI
jgi:hypothetical protein